jgi:hypothetical protein
MANLNRSILVLISEDDYNWIVQKRSEGYVGSFLIRKALHEMREKEKKGAR